MDAPLIIDHAFSEDMNNTLCHFMKNVTWYYGRKPHQDAPYSFWGTTYMQHPDFMGIGIKQALHPDAKILSEIWYECQKRLQENYQVLQIASNGQTYGQDGHMHPDDSTEGTYTLLIYATREWKVEWGGETSFYLNGNPHQNIGKNLVDIASVLPMPRRAVFFDSRLVHMGRAPNRIFSGMRITLAYKLRKK